MEVNIEEKYPLVTVIAACYNQERYVLESLESIKDQTYPNTEFIIWDDCSHDNSVNLIESWIKKNNIDCRFIKHTQNKGICKSLNEALSYAKGKYLQLIALDDIILPDKITKQVALFESLGDDFGVVFSDTYIIDENGTLTDETFHSKYIPYFKPVENYNYFESMLQGNIIHALASIFRIEVLKELGGYDESLFVEDWDMHIRLSLKIKIYFDNSYISSKYRVTSISTNNNPLYRQKCVDSSFNSLIKFLDITQRGNVLIADKLNDFAWQLYENDYTSWRDKFLILYKLNRNMKYIKYFLISRLNIKYSQYNIIKQNYKRLKKRIKGVLFDEL